jgi:uncharacterized hydrophobic protein (TIGR00271 family)
MESSLPPSVDEQLSEHSRSFWEALKRWFEDIIDLRKGADNEATIRSITEGKRMRGANAWMLMCSIMIASLGLDLNSPAVIIGAMLISPLMNPILGIALGIARNDREGLGLATKNFAIAILIALSTSMLYFWLTPLGTITPEIRARTAPTLLDGLVAIFGGLAGIISSSRKDESNALPGVAIATALMPPLCVTGFGVVNGEWDIAIRSFYLFFLNSFFIAGTAWIVIRVLAIPLKKYQHQADANRSRNWALAISLVMVIPSVFILQEVVQDLRYAQSVRRFVNDQFGVDCVDYKILKLQPRKDPLGRVIPLSQREQDSTILFVQLLDRNFGQDSILYFDSLLASKPYNALHTHIRPIPDYGLELAKLDNMQARLQSVDEIQEKLNQLTQAQSEKFTPPPKVNLSPNPLTDSLAYLRLTRLARAAFPELATLRAGPMYARSETRTDTLIHCIADFEPDIPEREEADIAARLAHFLQVGLDLDSLAQLRLIIE